MTLQIYAVGIVAGDELPDGPCVILTGDIAAIMAAAKMYGEDVELTKAGAVAELVDALDAWTSVYDNCSIETGCCCCGEPMEGHSNPMDAGHAPVDQGARYADGVAKQTRAALAKLRGAE